MHTNSTTPIPRSGRMMRTLHKLPSSVLLVLLMAVAAAPPAVLMALQREAHRPIPYLTIDVSTAPNGSEVLHASTGS